MGLKNQKSVVANVHLAGADVHIDKQESDNDDEESIKSYLRAQFKSGELYKDKKIKKKVADEIEKLPSGFVRTWYRMKLHPKWKWFSWLTSAVVAASMGLMAYFSMTSAVISVALIPFLGPAFIPMVLAITIASSLTNVAIGSIDVFAVIHYFKREILNELKGKRWFGVKGLVSLASIAALCMGTGLAFLITSLLAPHLGLAIALTFGVIGGAMTATNGFTALKKLIFNIIALLKKFTDVKSEHKKRESDLTGNVLSKKLTQAYRWVKRNLAALKKIYVDSKGKDGKLKFKHLAVDFFRLCFAVAAGFATYSTLFAFKVAIATTLAATPLAPVAVFAISIAIVSIAAFSRGSFALRTANTILNIFMGLGNREFRNNVKEHLDYYHKNPLIRWPIVVLRCSLVILTFILVVFNAAARFIIFAFGGHIEWGDGMGVATNIFNGICSFFIVGSQNAKLGTIITEKEGKKSPDHNNDDNPIVPKYLRDPDDIKQDGLSTSEVTSCEVSSASSRSSSESSSDGDSHVHPLEVESSRGSRLLTNQWSPSLKKQDSDENITTNDSSNGPIIDTSANTTPR